MLKSTTEIKYCIDINNFSKLVLYLKRMSDNCKPRKSKTLTGDEVNKSLQEAEGETF